MLCDFIVVNSPFAMKTVITTEPDVAADFIRRGGIVAFPTETVYGLGANVFDTASATRIFEAKMRPADNPLIAHVDSEKSISELAAEINGSARRFIDAFFPGPLTIVFRKTARVPLIATAGLDTIGVRMPHSKLARTFLKLCGTPVAAPSANISGRPSPTTWNAVLEDLDGRIDCILRGEPTEIGLESSVVDCTSDVPVLLRRGAVSLAELQAVVPETITLHPGANDPARSPGLRHKHYAPRARVVILDKDMVFEEIPDRSGSAYIGMLRPDAGFQIDRICDSPEEYAHSLFEFFRECDRLGIKKIYCQSVNEDGIGAALMDRLRRAAER